MEGLLPTKAPKVFISYAWGSGEHEQWVLRLQERLRGNAIDAIMDKTHLKKGNDLHAFMEQMVTNPEINHVLCICDANYQRKADAREGGVGAETQIITQDLYNKTKQEKFIPVLRERDVQGAFYCPVFLKTRVAVIFTEESMFEQSLKELTRHIYGQPDFPLPPLGERPSYLYDSRRYEHKTFSVFEGVTRSMTPQTETPVAASKKYLRALSSAVLDFRVSEDRELPSLDRLQESFASTASYREEFLEFLILVAGSEDIEKHTDLLHKFFESVAACCCTRLVNDEPKAFFIREAFLSFVAVMISEGHTAALDRFLRSKFIAEVNNRFEEFGYEVFDKYLEFTENFHQQERAAQGESNYPSLAAKIAIDRIADSKLTFEQLIEADVVLALRSIFSLGDDADRYSTVWFPRLLLLSGEHRNGKTLPTFARAIDPVRKKCALECLGFKSGEELEGAYAKMAQTERLKRIQYQAWYGAKYERMINLEKIVAR
ncbi:MAG: toll/interleukin-1 receptor domain-containing protein [Candidatus Sumerlaeia bacterium]|nr:toll/interleukin-1 receptor domain-containing protein [Candidatus Sumerlaeia bacterium]